LKGIVNGEEIFHFINEIPTGSRKKMELMLRTDGNPIMQDIKKGNLREFTYGDIPFNYGALPQTWEHPEHPDLMIGIKGDGDPIDIVEIGDSALTMGYSDIH
jgi:inorganic pyrophosphatase